MKILVPRKRKLFWLLSLVSLAAIIYGYLYYTMTDEISYITAKQFLSLNNQVKMLVGEPVSIKIKLFDEQHVEYSGSKGKANYYLRLTGSKTKGIANVTLERDGDWKVTTARLITEDGKEFNILTGLQ